MADKIVLPPLPEPEIDIDGDVHYLRSVLRAREIEVARVVLEAAAKVCEGERRLGIDDERAYHGDLMATEIRALEFTHAA